MRLALAFCRTHEELKNSMSAKELDAWIEFCRYEPIGYLRTDFAAAQIARAAAQSEKNKVEDFMPFHPSKIEQAQEEKEQEGTGTAEDFVNAFSMLVN